MSGSTVPITRLIGQEFNSDSEDSDEKPNIPFLCHRMFDLCNTRVQDDIDLWKNCVQIEPVLQKVRHRETHIRKPNEGSRNLDNFMSWLHENRANVDGASVAEYPGYGLGLRAERNFTENELMMKIPRRIIFSTETAAPELSSMQNDPMMKMMPQAALTIALLVEAFRENSKWRPYLDILPKKHDTVFLLSAKELLELMGSGTLYTVLKLRRNITRQYCYFRLLFEDTGNPVAKLLREHFTYEAFCWAASTVMTRQNLIPNEDGSTMIHALIPMWDMCNHEGGKISTGFDTTTDCCECFAMRDFKEGEQIFIDYGPRTNAEFFLNSGFVYMDHKEDALKVKFPISNTDNLYKTRLELLAKLQLSPDSVLLLRQGTEPFSPNVLDFVSVLRLNSEDLQHWNNYDKFADLQPGEFAVKAGIKEDVYKFLQQHMEQLIRRYRTTLKEDLNLLETTLPPLKRLMVQLHVTEKRILHGALDHVAKSIELTTKDTPAQV